MKRKINMVGTGTLTISIPSRWAKINNLKKGDEVEVVENDKILNIYSTKISNERKVVKINVSGPRRTIVRTLGNLYRKGADEIIVEYDNPGAFEHIEATVPFLTGFDIVEHDSHHCILKNIANIDEEEFDNSLRRMFLVTISLAKDSYNVIKNKDYDSLSGIAKLESTQNKLFMFCSRIVNTMGNLKFENPSLMYLFLQKFEEVADYYKRICDYIVRLNDKKFKLSEEVLEIYKRTVDMLEILYRIYYDFDLKKDEILLDLKYKNIDEGNELLKKVSKNEIRVVHLLIEIAGTIYGCSSPICGFHY